MPKVLIQDTPTYQLFAEHSVGAATGLHCLELTTVHPTMRNPVPHRVALLHMTEAQMHKLALTSAPALAELFRKSSDSLKVPRRPEAGNCDDQLYNEIGCQNYSYQNWNDFTDEEISEMATDALVWWKEWKPVLMAMAKIHQQKVAAVKGEAK